MSSPWHERLTATQRRLIQKRHGKWLKCLGTGSMAHAYLTDRDRVVKLTRDASDAMISAQLVGKNVPHVLKVFEVAELPSQDVRMWMIVSELVTPVKNDPAEFGELGGMYTDSGMSQAFDLNEMRQALRKLKTLTPEPGYQDLHAQYVALIGNLLKLGLPAHDIGPWNLGWRDHELVVFDLGGAPENSAPDVEMLKNAGIDPEVALDEFHPAGYVGPYMTIGEMLDYYTGSDDQYMAAAALDVAQELYGTTDPEELMHLTAESTKYMRRVEDRARSYRRQSHG